MFTHHIAQSCDHIAVNDSAFTSKVIFIKKVLAIVESRIGLDLNIPIKLAIQMNLDYIHLVR